MKSPSIKYLALSAGVIDLVAPGSSVTPKEIQEALKAIQGLGFKGRTSFCKAFVSNPEQKFKHFHQALMASDSLALWCVRGGYGSQKLMPYLIQLKKPKCPKLLIGYSDITALFTFFNLKWAWPTLHFPVLTHIKNSSTKDIKLFKNIAMGTQKELVFNGLKWLNPVKGGLVSTIKAPVTGGNLTIIQSSIGTPWAGNFKDKILFLEDIGEAPYRLDRALWQMLNAGVFKGIKALLLGDFTYSKSKNVGSITKKAYTKVVKDFAHQVSFPVVKGLPSGHGPKQSAPLPFMTMGKLLLVPQGKSQLKVESPF